MCCDKYIPRIRRYCPLLPLYSYLDDLVSIKVVGLPQGSFVPGHHIESMDGQSPSSFNKILALPFGRRSAGSLFCPCTESIFGKHPAYAVGRSCRDMYGPPRAGRPGVSIPSIPRAAFGRPLKYGMATLEGIRPRFHCRARRLNDRA